MSHFRRMASIALESVCKRYGPSIVVDHINLEIADGEFLVLVGPSGCGKTTTLRMIAGLESISSGKLSINGRLVNDVEPKDRGIGMVFQNYALYPHMSVRENLRFGLRLHNVPKLESDGRIEKTAELLGLSAVLDRKPRQLSGGQRQRVALGRAIVREPGVLLMDEPLSNLDAQLRVQTRGEILRLHQRVHNTVVYVTHDQVEAMTMADRIVVMHDGIIEQIGTPNEIYLTPATTFVAGFIGSPQMNLVAAPDGSPRTIGFRPEDLTLLHEKEGDASEGTVDLVETLGFEQHVYIRNHAGQTLIARAPSEQRFAIGDTVWMRVPMERLHTFDTATGRRI